MSIIYLENNQVVIPNRLKYHDEQLQYFIDFFKAAFSHKEKVLIRNKDLIDIDDMDIEDYGCYSCGVIGKSISLSGNYYDQEKVFRYEAYLKSVEIICKCDYPNGGIIDEYETHFYHDRNGGSNLPMMKFNGTIDRSYAYLFHWYLEVDDVKIVK